MGVGYQQDVYNFIILIRQIYCILGDSVWSEEENEGKLRTPDDERSSDSGFRDKGSLSESVEDACEDKYNLEDIEAELEQAFVKGAFNTPKNNSEINFEYEESQFYEDETKKDGDFSDVEGEMEFYPEISEKDSQAGDGWYLHPPDKTEEQGRIDDDFVAALRNELANKLPQQSRGFHSESEEEEDPTKLAINIDYSSSTPLSPISEDGHPPIFKSPTSTTRSRRKNITGLMESVRNIDTDTFVHYLDFMVENEGREDDILEEIDVEEGEGEVQRLPAFLISKPSGEEKEFDFERDISLVLGTDIEDEQPKSLVIFEDLELGEQCEVEDLVLPEDDVILVDTLTNEATLLESPRPTSLVAFDDGSLSEDSSRGEASTDMNYSPDLLSDVFITPDKTPFESPKTIPGVTLVEELKVESEAEEIVGALERLQTGNVEQILNESSKKLEKYEMSTSFMDGEGEWDSGTSDSDESTGEFIWKVS